MNVVFKVYWNNPIEMVAEAGTQQLTFVVPLGAMIPSLSGGGSVNGVESVNGKTGKHITLEASDLDTYTRSEIDARIPTKLSDLGNDVDFITEVDVDIKLESKQDVLPTNGNGSKYLSDDGTYKEIQPSIDAYTKAETDVLLDDKADKNSISVVGYSNNYNDLDNLPNIPVVPTNISAFNNDVGYLTQHQDISGKVDKEVGKGLSTNDYTNIDKSKVDKIVTGGVGDKYLSDDGNYKTVAGGGVSEVDVKGWIARNIAVNNPYAGYNAPPTASQSGSLAIGNSAIASSNDVIAIGANAKGLGSQVIAIGKNTRANDGSSVAIGDAAIASAYYAVAIGKDTKSAHSTISIGYKAGENSSTYTNCSHIGSSSNTTSSNQVQLGGSTTTTYAYGAVQDRSDARDKAHVRDIELGLDFINKLRPVEYKWDYREDYFRDIAPQRGDFEDEESYIQAVEQARVDFFKNPIKDGSKTRARHHTGLIAQEVKQAMDDLGVDFGGFQHHQEKGGLDVMSLGYNELIAVLIKAVQEVNLKCEQLQRELDVFRNNI